MINYEQKIKVKISNQGSYYKNLGYKNVKQGNEIEVLVSHLPLNSNKKIVFTCDVCEKEEERQYQLLNRQKIHRCRNCHYTYVFQNRDMSNTIKNAKERTGEKHPRWNPNKSDFQIYKSEVYKETRKWDDYLIDGFKDANGNIGLSGDVYQLDHIVSVKYGFNNNIPPEVIGHICNLKYIKRKDNRKKWHKSNNKELNILKEEIYKFENMVLV